MVLAWSPTTRDEGGIMAPTHEEGCQRACSFGRNAGPPTGSPEVDWHRAGAEGPSRATAAQTLRRPLVGPLSPRTPPESGKPSRAPQRQELISLNRPGPGSLAGYA